MKYFGNEGQIITKQMKIAPKDNCHKYKNSFIFEVGGIIK